MGRRSQDRRIEGLGRWVGPWLTVVACLVIAWAGFRAVTILTGLSPFGENSWIPPSALPQLTQLELGGSADPRLQVTVIPLWLRLLSVLALLVSAASAAAALWWTRRIVARIGGGEPFHPEVIRSLRVTAIALIGGALLRPLVDVATIAGLMNWASSQRGTSLGLAPPELSLTLLTVGLVAACLLVAFRSGARLAEDAVGVV